MNTQWLKILALVLTSGQVVAQEESKSIFAKLKEKEAQQKVSPVKLSQEELHYKQQFDAELANYTRQYLQEFADYKKQYNAELSAYRAELLSHWGEVDVSTNSKVVDYADQNVKTVVDFDKNEVVVSVLHDDDSAPDVKVVERAIKRLGTLKPDPKLVTNSQRDAPSVNILAELIDPIQARTIINDTETAVRQAQIEIVVPVINASDFQTEKAVSINIQKQDKQQIEIIAEKANLSDQQINTIHNSIGSAAFPINHSTVNATTIRKQEQLKKKRITRYKITVIGKSDRSRVGVVKPFADMHAAKWQLPIELIIAIIHTESSFNPMAVSSIPAYGLMQIVPTSAGIDVNEFLNDKREPMQTAILFKAEENIQAGSAYLHILDNRYLRKITNQASRIYCVIAAYNTGVGNVARAFNEGNGRRLTDEVVMAINSMSPDQVYAQLLKALPYEETRKYLNKVRTRMSHYADLVQSMNSNSEE